MEEETFGIQSRGKNKGEKKMARPIEEKKRQGREKNKFDAKEKSSNCSESD